MRSDNPVPRPSILNGFGRGLFFQVASVGILSGYCHNALRCADGDSTRFRTAVRDEFMLSGPWHGTGFLEGS